MSTSFVIYLIAFASTLGGIGIAAYTFLVHRREFPKIREWHEMKKMKITIEALQHDLEISNNRLNDLNQKLIDAEDAFRRKKLCEEYLKNQAGWEAEKKTLEISRAEYAERARQEQERYSAEKSRVDDLANKMAEKERSLESLIKREAELPLLIKQKQEELDSLNKKIEELAGDNGAIKALEVKILDMNQEIKKLTEEKENASKELLSQIESLKNEKSELEKQKVLSASDLEQIKKSIAQKQEDLQKIRKQYEDVTTNANNAKAIAQKVAEEAKEKAEKVAAEHRKSIRELETRITELREGVARLEGQKKELEIRIKTVGKLPPEAFDSLRRPRFEYQGPKGKDEKVVLETIKKMVETRGYEISDRMQYAFHTSLKTSDISCLTVMAGVSGTGKSAFPKIYADAVGLHFLPLAVEPRWDSPQDLFGFLNYMESRFEATTLGRALVQFDNSAYANRHPSNVPLDDQMLLVMLDEMNLARIEYYFSEFLSKLEMRRDANLEDSDDFKNVSVEIYQGYDEDNAREIIMCDPIRLFAGRNVLFVGTMNEDETTQSISDKVIDRANVLYFGRPTKLKNRTDRALVAGPEITPLSFQSWNTWIRQPIPESIPLFDEVERSLNEFNSTLGKLGRPFGHRAFQAMLSYIANHPYVALRQANKDYKRPLADQVAMRIMPKLRGVGLNDYSEVFDELEKRIAPIQDRALTAAFQEARNPKRGFFDWRGIDWDMN